MHSPIGTDVHVTLTAQQVPYFLQGRALTVTTAKLAARVAHGQSLGTLAFTLNGHDVHAFAADAQLADLHAVDVREALGGLLGDHTLQVVDAGDLAPDPAVAGDPSALDDARLLDLILYVEFTAA